jgi:cytochrome c
MRKKLLALTLSLASLGFVASSAQASEASISPAVSTATSAAQPQWRRDRWGRRNNRRVYVTTQSRLVRYGRQLFRETYQVRHLPNGRTQTRLISRVRVR